MNTNTCNKYSSCSASFCPQTGEGKHMTGDGVCPKTGTQWSQNFNRDCKGISSSEAQALILSRYTKQQITIH